MPKQDIVSEGESNLLLQTDKNTADRFVAFLDIMGFKERVARTEHSQLLTQLTNFNRAITGYIGKYQATEIQLAQFSDSIVLFSNDTTLLAQFSDSIVLFSNDTTLNSLETLADVTRGIMQTAIKQQIPIKGAIAQGQITCDIPKQLFFGQALIDAYLLEENIHYYGILVHHTAENSVTKLNNENNNNIFKDIKAPLKSGKISHYELSWYINDDPQTIEEKVSEMNDALKAIRQTVSDAPRKYIDNTLDVINEYYKKKDETQPQ